MAPPPAKKQRKNDIVCFHCKEAKPRDAFSKNQQRKGGQNAKCKLCMELKLLCSQCNRQQGLNGFSKQEREKVTPTCNSCCTKNNAPTKLLQCSSCQQNCETQDFSRNELKKSRKKRTANKLTSLSGAIAGLSSAHVELVHSDFSGPMRARAHNFFYTIASRQIFRCRPIDHGINPTLIASLVVNRVNRSFKP